MKVLALLVLAAVVGMAIGEEKQYYCGRHLAETLANLCYPTNLVKRSDPEWPWLPEQPEQPEQQEQRQDKEDRNRNKRGVVDECCLNPCYVEDLLTYC